ncbi:MAG: alpha/beta hydrolase [Myxococcota bacterium]
MSTPSRRPPQRADDVRTGYAIADDGIQLYWRAIGTGPAILCNNGVGVGTFFWKYLVERFRDQYTVILWDYRGHGRSSRNIDPEQADLSVLRHTRDAHFVVEDALRPHQDVILIGHSMGVQVALEFRRRYPGRVQAMVLMLGTAGRALDTFFDWEHSPLVFRALRRLVSSLGPAANEIMRPALHSPLAWPVACALYLVDPLYTRREDLQRYTEHIASLDARLFIESVCQLNLHSAWESLDDIDEPVLVIAAEKDTFTPLWCSQKMVDAIDGAEMLVLADASHAALIEQPETINHRIARFFREQLNEPGAPPQP